MLILHCLNLKITYECTNDCSFCFSSYLKDNIMSMHGMKEAIKKGYDNGSRELVISGGEPTTKPGDIVELMSLAEHLGYQKYILQTNGSGLADNRDLLDFLDFTAQKKEVCVSFSIHGSNAKLHDAMSRTSGAYEKLLRAIKNVRKTRCKIYTNTVISSININDLKEIAKLILPYKPEIMQFSIMHTASPGALAVSLIDSVFAIRELKELVDLDVLKTEGIPYCLLHGMEKCVGESFWPGVLDIYNRESSYMSDFKQLNHGMRCKADFCTSCIMNNICMGVWSENSKEFYELGIRPIM